MSDRNKDQQKDSVETDLQENLLAETLAPALERIRKDAANDNGYPRQAREAKFYGADGQPVRLKEVGDNQPVIGVRLTAEGGRVLEVFASADKVPAEPIARQEFTYSRAGNVSTECRVTYDLRKGSDPATVTEVSVDRSTDSTTISFRAGTDQQVVELSKATGQPSRFNITGPGKNLTCTFDDLGKIQTISVNGEMLAGEDLTKFTRSIRESLKELRAEHGLPQPAQEAQAGVTAQRTTADKIRDLLESCRIAVPQPGLFRSDDGQVAAARLRQLLASPRAEGADAKSKETAKNILNSSNPTDAVKHLDALLKLERDGDTHAGRYLLTLREKLGGAPRLDDLIADLKSREKSDQALKTLKRDIGSIESETARPARSLEDLSRAVSTLTNDQNPGANGRNADGTDGAAKGGAGGASGADRRAKGVSGTDRTVPGGAGGVSGTDRTELGGASGVGGADRTVPGGADGAARADLASRSGAVGDRVAKGGGGGGPELGGTLDQRQQEYRRILDYGSTAGRALVRGTADYIAAAGMEPDARLRVYADAMRLPFDQRNHHKLVDLLVAHYDRAKTDQEKNIALQLLGEQIQVGNLSAAQAKLELSAHYAATRMVDAQLTLEKSGITGEERRRAESQRADALRDLVALATLADPKSSSYANANALLANLRGGPLKGLSHEAVAKAEQEVREAARKREQFIVESTIRIINAPVGSPQPGLDAVESAARDQAIIESHSRSGPVIALARTTLALRQLELNVNNPERAAAIIKQLLEVEAANPIAKRVLDVLRETDAGKEAILVLKQGDVAAAALLLHETADLQRLNREVARVRNQIQEYGKVDPRALSSVLENPGNLEAAKKAARELDENMLKAADQKIEQFLKRGRSSDDLFKELVDSMKLNKDGSLDGSTLSKSIIARLDTGFGGFAPEAQPLIAKLKNPPHQLSKEDVDSLKKAYLESGIPQRGNTLEDLRKLSADRLGRFGGGLEDAVHNLRAISSVQDIHLKINQAMEKVNAPEGSVAERRRALAEVRAALEQLAKDGSQSDLSRRFLRAFTDKDLKRLTEALSGEPHVAASALTELRGKLPDGHTELNEFRALRIVRGLNEKSSAADFAAATSALSAEMSAERMAGRGENKAAKDWFKWTAATGAVKDINDALAANDKEKALEGIKTLERMTGEGNEQARQRLFLVLQGLTHPDKHQSWVAQAEQGLGKPVYSLNDRGSAAVRKDLAKAVFEAIDSKVGSADLDGLGAHALTSAYATLDKPKAAVRLLEGAMRGPRGSEVLEGIVHGIADDGIGTEGLVPTFLKGPRLDTFFSRVSEVHRLATTGNPAAMRILSSLACGCADRDSGAEYSQSAADTMRELSEHPLHRKAALSALLDMAEKRESNPDYKKSHAPLELIGKAAAFFAAETGDVDAKRLIERSRKFLLNEYEKASQSDEKPDPYKQSVTGLLAMAPHLQIDDVKMLLRDLSPVVIEQLRLHGPKLNSEAKRELVSQLAHMAGTGWAIKHSERMAAFAALAGVADGLTKEELQSIVKGAKESPSQTERAIRAERPERKPTEKELKAIAEEKRELENLAGLVTVRALAKNSRQDVKNLAAEFLTTGLRTWSFDQDDRKALIQVFRDGKALEPESVRRMAKICREMEIPAPAEIMLANLGLPVDSRLPELADKIRENYKYSSEGGDEILRRALANAEAANALTGRERAQILGWDKLPKTQKERLGWFDDPPDAVLARLGSEKLPKARREEIEQQIQSALRGGRPWDSELSVGVKLELIQLGRPRWELLGAEQKENFRWSQVERINPAQLVGQMVNPATETASTTSRTTPPFSIADISANARLLNKDFAIDIMRLHERRAVSVYSQDREIQKLQEERKQKMAELLRVTKEGPEKSIIADAFRAYYGTVYGGIKAAWNGQSMGIGAAEGFTTLSIPAMQRLRDRLVNNGVDTELAAKQKHLLEEMEILTKRIADHQVKRAELSTDERRVALAEGVGRHRLLLDSGRVKEADDAAIRLWKEQGPRILSRPEVWETLNGRPGEVGAMARLKAEGLSAWDKIPNYNTVGLHRNAEQAAAEIKDQVKQITEAAKAGKNVELGESFKNYYRDALATGVAPQFILEVNRALERSGVNFRVKDDYDGPPLAPAPESKRETLAARRSNPSEERRIVFTDLDGKPVVESKLDVSKTAGLKRNAEAVADEIKNQVKSITEAANDGKNFDLGQAFKNSYRAALASGVAPQFIAEVNGALERSGVNLRVKGDFEDAPLLPGRRAEGKAIVIITDLDGKTVVESRLDVTNLHGNREHARAAWQAALGLQPVVVEGLGKARHEADIHPEMRGLVQLKPNDFPRAEIRDALVLNALKTLDSDPVIQKFQGVSAELEGPLSKMSQLFQGGMEGTPYHDFVNEAQRLAQQVRTTMLKVNSQDLKDLRERIADMDKALEKMKEDGRGTDAYDTGYFELQKRIDNLKRLHDTLNPGPERLKPELVKDIYGKPVLDPVTDQPMYRDAYKDIQNTLKAITENGLKPATLTNWFKENGPIIGATIGAMAATVAACATFGISSPAAVAAWMAVGGLVGREAMRERLYQLNKDGYTGYGSYGDHGADIMNWYRLSDRRTLSNNVLSLGLVVGNYALDIGKDFVLNILTGAVAGKIVGGQKIGDALAAQFKAAPNPLHLAFKAERTLLQLEGKALAKSYLKEFLTHFGEHLVTNVGFAAVHTGLETSLKGSDFHHFFSKGGWLGHEVMNWGLSTSLAVGHGLLSAARMKGGEFHYKMKDGMSKTDFVRFMQSEGFVVTQSKTPGVWEAIPVAGGKDAKPIKMVEEKELRPAEYPTTAREDARSSPQAERLPNIVEVGNRLEPGRSHTVEIDGKKVEVKPSADGKQFTIEQNGRSIAYGLAEDGGKFYLVRVVAGGQADAPAPRTAREPYSEPPQKTFPEGKPPKREPYSEPPEKVKLSRDSEWTQSEGGKKLVADLKDISDHMLGRDGAPPNFEQAVKAALKEENLPAKGKMEAVAVEVKLADVQSDVGKVKLLQEMQRLGTTEAQAEKVVGKVPSPVIEVDGVKFELHTGKVIAQEKGANLEAAQRKFADFKTSETGQRILAEQALIAMKERINVSRQSMDQGVVSPSYAEFVRALNNPSAEHVDSVNGKASKERTRVTLEQEAMLALADAGWDLPTLKHHFAGKHADVRDPVFEFLQKRAEAKEKGRPLQTVRVTLLEGTDHYVYGLRRFRADLEPSHAQQSGSRFERCTPEQAKKLREIVDRELAAELPADQKAQRLKRLNEDLEAITKKGLSDHLINEMIAAFERGERPPTVNEKWSDGAKKKLAERKDLGGDGAADLLKAFERLGIPQVPTDTLGPDLLQLKKLIESRDKLAEQLRKGSVPDGLDKAQWHAVLEAIDARLRVDSGFPKTADKKGAYKRAIDESNALLEVLADGKVDARRKSALADIFSSMRRVSDDLPVPFARICKEDFPVEHLARFGKFLKDIRGIDPSVEHGNLGPGPTAIMKALIESPDLKDWAFLPAARSSRLDQSGVDGMFFNLKTGELRPVDFKKRLGEGNSHKWAFETGGNIDANKMPNAIKDFLAKNREFALPKELVDKFGFPPAGPERSVPDHMVKRATEMRSYLDQLHDHVVSEKKAGRSIPKGTEKFITGVEEAVLHFERASKLAQQLPHALEHHIPKPGDPPLPVHTDDGKGSPRKGQRYVEIELTRPLNVEVTVPRKFESADEVTPATRRSPKEVIVEHNEPRTYSASKVRFYEDGSVVAVPSTAESALWEAGQRRDLYRSLENHLRSTGGAGVQQLIRDFDILESKITFPKR
ncbi:MAG: hypothetical protein K2W95_33620 [Candidatus Obscuribacterales bacterium]|nr:hypothetical protein [Candidatus Obscuribacterales bacterium]